MEQEQAVAGGGVGDILSHFPPQFSPRDQQVDAITQIAQGFNRGARVVVLEMPTGGGKSFVTQTFARAVRAKGGKTHFLTIQKILQEQYAVDFPAPEIELCKGRSNYPCTHKENTGKDCSKGVCKSVGRGILPECVTGVYDMSDVMDFSIPPEAHKCPYWKQLTKAVQSPITLFNFDSFLFQQRIGRFGGRDLMIIDEAHNVESKLMGFVELSLSDDTLDLVNVSITRDINSKARLTEWIRETNILTLIRGAIEAKKDGSLGDDFTKALGEMEDDVLAKVLIKLETLLAYLDKTDWIVETVTYERRDRSVGKKIVCRPLYAKDFANDLLFKHAKRVLAVSATILSKEIWAQNLGLDPTEVCFVQQGSDFPVENRPIHLSYVGNMSYKEKPATMPKLLNWIENVCLPKHHGQRGIIHAHSFDIAREIVNKVRDPRLLLHESGVDKKEVLERHASRPDSVIVAPAFHEGVDLKDDLSRFQVICKVPYPSMTDKVIAERMGRDNEFYSWLACLKLVQSYGRSVRSKTDHAETYITDSGFNGLRYRAGHLLPKWFTEAIIQAKR